MEERWQSGGGIGGWRRDGRWRRGGRVKGVLLGSNNANRERGQQNGQDCMPAVLKGTPADGLQCIDPDRIFN